MEITVLINKIHRLVYLLNRLLMSAHKRRIKVDITIETLNPSDHLPDRKEIKLKTYKQVDPRKSNERYKTAPPSGN